MNGNNKDLTIEQFYLTEKITLLLDAFKQHLIIRELTISKLWNDFKKCKRNNLRNHLFRELKRYGEL